MPNALRRLEIVAAPKPFLGQVDFGLIQSDKPLVALESIADVAGRNEVDASIVLGVGIGEHVIPSEADVHHISVPNAKRPEANPAVEATVALLRKYPRLICL